MSTNNLSDIDEVMTTIRSQLSALPDFAQVQLHVKKHVGSFGKTDVVKTTTFMFSDNEPNVTAATQVFQLMKNLAEAQIDGSLSFTVQFKKGRAQQMQVQDFVKI
jgi:hypothetical protein